MPSREELADSFAQDTEDNWSFPISITLIKSFQQRDNALVKKAESIDQAYYLPFSQRGSYLSQSQSSNPTTIEESCGQMVP